MVEDFLLHVAFVVVHHRYKVHHHQWLHALVLDDALVAHGEGLALVLDDALVAHGEDLALVVEHLDLVVAWVL